MMHLLLIPSTFTHINTVKDCEAIRKILIGDRDDPEDRKWTILGYSFGGFCAVNYLSYYGEGLKEVFIAGGLPPFVDSPDPVYKVLLRERSTPIVFDVSYNPDAVISRSG